MGKRATIDVDGTTAETTGCCKEGMDLNYKVQWGYGPLVVSLAETNETLSTRSLAWVQADRRTKERWRGSIEP